MSDVPSRGRDESGAKPEKTDNPDKQVIAGQAVGAAQADRSEDPKEQGKPESGDKPDWVALLPVISHAFREMVPHNLALGMELESIGDGEAVLRLPYKPELVGDPETGVIHGGAITALVDAASGLSVFMRLRRDIPIATLDLRIDYLRPAAPGRAVSARAECYRATRDVAFVRAVAFQGDESRPVATSASTFMIGTRGRSVVGPRVSDLASGEAAGGGTRDAGGGAR